MRLHFLVLLAAVLIIVTDAHPVNKRSEEEEDAVSNDISDDVKKSNIKDEEEEEEDEETAAARKTNIASTKNKKAITVEVKKVENTEKKKEKVKTNEKVSDKKVSELKSNEEHHTEEEEDDEALEEKTKKDKVKTEKKEIAADEKKAAATETIAPGKSGASEAEKKSDGKEIEKTEKLPDKKTIEKKAEDNAKKWWRVGDSEHWGGRGHGHWGPPHHAEEDNYQHHGHGEGHKRHHKSHVSRCCKSKDKNVRKRCECSHHGDGDGDAHKLEGYHFHERGHGGHNDHDHDLKGPWAFGYDGFGDDWNDWDHNHGNFEHLQTLEKESHEGHHEEGHHGYHGDDEGHDCNKRNCVQLPTEPLAGTRLSIEPLGAPVVAAANGPVLATEPGSVGPVGPVLGQGPVPFMGAGGVPMIGPGGAPIFGPGQPPVLAMPDGGAPIAPGGLVPVPLPAGNRLPYRVCHDCQILKNGGSRCLCKSVHHPVHHASTNYDHHVYIDCDAAVHNYPSQNTLCYPRAGIPTPENNFQQEGKPKQGVVYPYVGYGPWSAYPWWGDWWGGHGNHGWGGQNACEHPCEHEKHGCECHHNEEHGDHEVDVDHGESLVHHEHNGGHSSGRHDGGRDVGFSLGGHSGSNLHAYRCHDVVESKNENPETKAKRFCVPVGYHGGYGWPYWHGYPGVGTGLWGWGWPWIKNKVPGSKLKEGRNKTSSSPGDKDEVKTNNRRSYVTGETKKTKKQTIHVGYGYASGDNYRLGYGYGGMGGVAGFAPGANAIGEGGTQNPFSRSKIETEEESALSFAKNNIPTPVKEETVTGTKRDFEKLDHNGETSNTNI